MPGRDITLDSPIGLKERPSSHKGKERAPRDAPFMISHKRLQEALNVDARDNTQSPSKLESRAPNGADREMATKADDLAGDGNGADMAPAVPADLPSHIVITATPISIGQELLDESSPGRASRIWKWLSASARESALGMIEDPEKTIKQKGPSLWRVVGLHILRKKENDAPTDASAAGSDSTSNISDDKGSKKKESSLVRMVKEMDGVEDYTRCNPLAQQQY
ncbi:hypothetical protein GLAREA_10818 [Glarea lozoyensis ATCC 20868]|uniref:Uncharacterized protein n=1 Tax=Glarea lozoyensis (strain ATCC 20868 / MF5171) TaxID=1116229 RepID=S3D9G4_GLAL2|nr:uncharacterized protein GLAREA_10818 [Glarea lozoyensis ATCC 20868]EPE35122.1 hypothetical protein GLAREA_10818 [Glarea lozoyensis ATCC 20868]